MTTTDALTMIARINAVHNALDALKGIDAITYYRVEDDGDRVVVSLRTGYLNDYPNIGYDGETEARGRKIDEALGALGLSLHDAGTEDDGEYWIFRA